jgi:hypothetical protein
VRFYSTFDISQMDCKMVAPFHAKCGNPFAKDLEGYSISSGKIPGICSMNCGKLSRGYQQSSTNATVLPPLPICVRCLPIGSLLTFAIGY